jgi:acetate kinase
MNVLVINCGSSSIKFKLFNMPEAHLMFSAKADKLPDGNTSFFFISKKRNWNFQLKGFSFSHNFKCLVEELVNPDNECLNSLNDIDVAGHRLIHGGKKVTTCVEITGEELEKMKKNMVLAPLHYPANIAGIEMISQMLPDILQAGVFDTAFHHTIPPKAFLYGIPMEWYTGHGIRRYGFHGTSVRDAAERACRLTHFSFKQCRIIVCHLGNGASVTAIRNGKSIDTSMGMTPVEGLVMGTRCGDIDAGVLIHLQEYFNLSFAEVSELINKKSGLFGVSGISSDYRVLEEAAGKGNDRAKLALEIFHYRVKKYIGSYVAALEGLDLLVFTGGIGENSIKARNEICRGLNSLGMRLSPSLNIKENGKEAVIHSKKGKVKVVIIPAGEELAIARQVAKLAMQKANSSPGNSDEVV